VAKRRALLSALVIALTIVVPSRADASGLPHGNLLRNGGFELNAGSDGSTQVLPARWHVIDQPATVVNYAEGQVNSYPPPEIAQAIAGGNNFLAGSPTAGDPTSTTVQMVPVPDTATRAIDAGKVSVTLSADLGGYAGQNDVMDATIEFLNAKKISFIGASFTLGGPNSVGRSGTTGFVFVAASGTVPKHTRYFRVRLDALREDTSASPAANDGYADNLRLEFGLFPHVQRALSLTVDPPSNQLYGTLGAAYPPCGVNQTVRLYERRRTGDKLIKTALTDANQDWAMAIPPEVVNKTVYALTSADAAGYPCARARSEILKLD